MASTLTHGDMEVIRDEIQKGVEKERDCQDRKRITKNIVNDWAAHIIRDATASCGRSLTRDQFETAMLKVATLAIKASQESAKC